MLTFSFVVVVVARGGGVVVDIPVSFLVVSSPLGAHLAEKKRKEKKKQLSISVVDIPRRARIQILPLSRTVRGLCSVFIQEINNCLTL